MTEIGINKRKNRDTSGEPTESKRTKASSFSPADGEESEVLDVTANACPSRAFFPFMQFAREIRDMVYHELWKETPNIKAPQRRSRLIARYDDSEDSDDSGSFEPRGLPFWWLLTSKAILEEGMAQFRRKEKWLSSPCNCGETGFCLARPIKYSRKISPLLSPSRAREMTLNDTYHCHLNILGAGECEFTRDMCQLFRGSTRLKVLRLCVNFSSREEWENFWPLPSKLDFSFLDNLDLQLETFEVVAEEIQQIRPKEDSLNLKRAFGKEVWRVGSLLGSGVGQLSIRDEYYQVSIHYPLDTDSTTEPQERVEDFEMLDWRFVYQRVVRKGVDTVV
ncbi:hypothetical protein K505DRAFT_322405 [Melanomma pulvis-pyrius CBS 109.77]|uniref:Uncharacterized protein n=1 Tax=Melanomma pulvis-pyrius CBS 109.77 TaxID=1314802 RepID=A0A6A6XMB1_9PLEO|nr:hypothetical protein K505DRAFT_322405 [Melanomma pulvis-pyrius CBS 109.77]